jgi:site-specific recombinase
MTKTTQSYNFGFEEEMILDMKKEVKNGKLENYKEFCQKWSEKFLKSLENEEARKWNLLNNELLVDLNEAMKYELEDSDAENYFFKLDRMLEIALEEYNYQVISGYAWNNDIELD